MPTPAERLATLEAQTVENRADLLALHADIHGGPGVEWNRSIRGRLHSMSSAIEAADKLADAARALAREQAENRKSRIKAWQWTVIASCAIVTAIAAVIGALVPLL
jgi:hypothetical protein